MKVAEKYTDAELIAAITSGKHLDPAIHSLYRQFSEAIRSFIMSYGGNEQDADDVFQETVIAFIDSVKKGKYRQESSVKTFLASVARHIWFNDLKKKERAGIREKNTNPPGTSTSLTSATRSEISNRGDSCATC
ncbi:RNA polymerase sigma factor [Puia sp. P3]|uniref:RNA polymerase sigma factor n=1 Tax=Puia sp. P3 TaxID=3423952 RepID=UPI003D67C2F5